MLSKLFSSSSLLLSLLVDIPRFAIYGNVELAGGFGVRFSEMVYLWKETHHILNRRNMPLDEFYSTYSKESSLRPSTPSSVSSTGSTGSSASTSSFYPPNQEAQ